MFPSIYRFLSTQWRDRIWRTFQHLWKTFLGLTSSNTKSSPHIPRYPLTKEQRETRDDEFINALDKEAICGLASRYNNNLPCHVLDTNRGSFNVCFFVEFPSADTTWVVRVPIEPALHDVWAKLQSEVTTMRYIQQKTDIPIAWVHAYGRAQLRHNDPTEHAFMITDYIPGRPLTKIGLLGCSEERRRQFFSELIDVFAQLRGLEFPAAGSLMPSLDGGTEPAVISALSVPLNELRVGGHAKPGPATTTSATQFLADQYRVLWKTFLLPAEELDSEGARLELFALHHIKQLLSEIVLDDKCSRFILAHTDLRCANIIVDEKLHINGIIDWEWSSAVPKEIFTPPSWVTGHDPSFVLRSGDRPLAPDFFAALATRSNLSVGHSQLMHEWSQTDSVALPVARILRYPYDLDDVFYDFIFPKLFAQNRRQRRQVVPNFFERHDNAALSAEAENRVRASEEYTQYLKDNDLFKVDEIAQKRMEWAVKAREYRKSIGLHS